MFKYKNPDLHSVKKICVCKNRITARLFTHGEIYLFCRRCGGYLRTDAEVKKIHWDVSKLFPNIENRK